jgi:hypothetical protein
MRPEGKTTTKEEVVAAPAVAAVAAAAVILLSRVRVASNLDDVDRVGLFPEFTCDLTVHVSQNNKTQGRNTDPSHIASLFGDTGSI